jgi:large subunit ribosomal protein L3
LKEFKVNDTNEFEIGQILNVDSFSPGQLVNIRGKTIGKGFSGLQKRHNFTRGPMTHGSKNHRAPGSIGMGTTPGRVLPGKKMAGQLGNKITTIKKLKVIQINSEENILVIKGSVPGKPGNLLSIVPSE